MNGIRYGVIRRDGTRHSTHFELEDAQRVARIAGSTGPQVRARRAPGADVRISERVRSGYEAAYVGVYVLVRDPGCTEYLQLVGCADPEDVKTLEALKIKALENC